MWKQCRACLNTIASTEIRTDGEKQIAADEEQPQAENNLLSPNLHRLFLDFTTLDVRLEVKEFPKRVCQLCLANLIVCDAFRKKALASTRILKESLKDHLIENIGDKDVVDEVRIHTGNSFIKEESTYSDTEIDPKDFCDVGIDDHDMHVDVDFKIETDGPNNRNDGNEIDKDENEDFNDNDDEDFKVDINDAENDADEHASDEDINDNDDEDFKVDINEAENDEDEHARSNSPGSQSKSPIFERLSENLDDQIGDTNIGAEDDSSVISRTKNVPTQEIKNDNFYCYLCNKQCRMELSFNAHMLKVHHGIERPYACQKCSKTFTTNKQLTVHIRDKCGVSQKNNTVLKDNIQYRAIKTRGKEVESGRSSCEICGKKFKTKRSLITHMQRHKDIKNYQCLVCDVSKTTADELNIHMRVHAEDVEKFKCPQCPQTFSYKNAIARHVRVKHEGIKRFPCSHCPKRFATYNAQISHENGTHGEGRNFICKTCYRSFSMEKTLTNHLKKHQKITCNLCPKRFMNLKTLAAHQKVHLGDNPIVCSTCSHGFHSILDLQEHSKQHENDNCGDDNENPDINSVGGECDAALKADIKTPTDTDSVNNSLNNKNIKRGRKTKSAVKRSNNISDGGSPEGKNHENKKNKNVTARHSARSSSRKKERVSTS